MTILRIYGMASASVVIASLVANTLDSAAAFPLVLLIGFFTGLWIVPK